MFHIKVKEYRKELGVSQQELCEGIISRNHLSTIENGLSKTLDKVKFQLFQRLYFYGVVKEYPMTITFDELVDYEPYQAFQEISALVRKISDHTWTPLSKEELQLVRKYIIMQPSGFEVFELIFTVAESFERNQRREDSFFWYLKAFDWLLFSKYHVDFNFPFLRRFFNKMFYLGLALERYDHLIDLLDFWDIRYVEQDNRKNPNQHYNRALLYKKIGNGEKAMTYLKEIIEQGERYEPLTLAKSYHLKFMIEQKHRPEEALQSFEKARSLYEGLEAYSQLDKLLEEHDDYVHHR